MGKQWPPRSHSNLANTAWLPMSVPQQGSARSVTRYLSLPVWQRKLPTRANLFCKIAAMCIIRNYVPFGSDFIGILPWMELSKAPVLGSSYWLPLWVKSINNGFYVFNESIPTTQNLSTVNGEQSQSWRLADIPRFFYLLRDKSNEVL